ncbi:MAG: UDP-glucose 4-epimerase [Moraxellaceae bacterium]|jgi:UDP-glucose 4-epimerase|nr:UDP-glucose 4-epimerase [Moraxellaceae bacterium]
MKVMVTGGAGYIGTHTCVELLAAGHVPVVVDNFCNSRPEALSRVRAIAGREFPVHEMDVRDREALRRVFAAERPDAVIHFAGLKAVGESVAVPWRYYDNNLGSTLALVEVMREAGCRQLVFSSSATVYGIPEAVPLTEDSPLAAINPYGRTKLMIEQMLQDLALAEPDWQVALLRYFNPVGAHESGLIGEDPAGIPNNLMPFVTQVAVGRLPRLRIFGGDYPTPDGTGVRDYLHVVDLAQGHVKALDWLATARPGGATAINLGTGRGRSVLELVRAFEAASGRAIPYDIVPRRAGDAANCCADPALAARLLGWTATRGLDAMCRDAWRWQSQNPQGYGEG